MDDKKLTEVIDILAHTAMKKVLVNLKKLRNEGKTLNEIISIVEYQIKKKEKKKTRSFNGRGKKK